jgi:hypothetical protein
MLARPLAALLALSLAAPPARAAVVVVANYTAEPVAFTVAEPKAKARKHTLGPNRVEPVYVTGPADLAFAAKGRDFNYRLDPYCGYVFLPDKDAGLRFEGVEMPGEALERDARPELNPAPRDPAVRVPVTLLVDDADPRADKLWRKQIRARFEEVSEVVERASGIRLEVAGFDTWKSDPAARNLTDLLAGFEGAVKVKPGALAVGYTSRKIDEKVDPAFGIGRGLGGRHVLLREWRPKNEPERTEVMLHYVAQALGAVGTPDPGSAMRAKLADGYILFPKAVLRLDPLNALAMNLWADERRSDPAVEVGTLSPVNRHRLARIYKALLKASPGDTLALSYLDGLGRGAARKPDPEPNPGAKQPGRQPVAAGRRDELVRKVVQAVAARAAENAAAGASALSGDELTAAYVRVAAEVAMKNPGPEVVSGFLIGTGLALDDADALLTDPSTAAAVKAAETLDERKARIAALGNPTLAGRRDLCRRFFVGCATGELLAQHVAEKLAAARVPADLHSPSGLCLPALAAEFAGVAFARAAYADPELIRRAAEKFQASDYLPPLAGLRNGLSPEKFAELYGGAGDDRFAAVLADIRKRLKAMRGFE